MDVRLKIFQRNLHLFKNKDVLDIGCNVGLMTLAVAKLLSPKSIVGVDIDRKLINIARNKLKKYVAVPSQIADSDLNTETVKRNSRTECFPMSFPMCYGNLSAAFQKIQKKVQTPQTLMSTPQTPQNEVQSPRIPENVSFEEVRWGIHRISRTFHDFHHFQMNYVPKDEFTSSRDTGKYDLILCLSVTKWIHLNYGDIGVKLTFRKIFNQLRPGGKLILELQNWPSYKKKKKMTSQIHDNYKNIKFSPSNFADYLLSQEVGFSHYYTLGVTQHLSKGFRRPIFLFVKGEFTPREGKCGGFDGLTFVSSSLPSSPQVERRLLPRDNALSPTDGLLRTKPNEQVRAATVVALAHAIALPLQPTQSNAQLRHLLQPPAVRLSAQLR
jgi:7SK snRNA methylphosphate capping enzyme